MTNPQRILIAAVFVVALVGGGILAIALAGGGGPGASPSPVAVASPATSASSPPSAEPSPAPTDQAPPTATPASPAPSAQPSASPAPTASAAQPTLKPTVAPGPPATLTLQDLKLDAREDPDGRNRRIAFRSQGSGTIRVDMVVTSPQGTVVMCLNADGERLRCKTAAEGSITAKTTSRRRDFVLTLRGEGIAAPVVDVTVTFPARTPAVTIGNARFDGTMYPDTNGIVALLKPRSDADVTVEAAWGGKPFPYELDLLEQGGPGAHVLANQGPATSMAESLPVMAGNRWRLVLQNISEGFGVTQLDATIAWP